VLGSSGEFALMDKMERFKMMETVKKYSNKKN